ncbi:MAG: deoxyribose-phosphate aldolase [Planctomycetota bacterium]|nr:deoxyribose-phosphate aldolase [Planctomycetota bacterium]
MQAKELARLIDHALLKPLQTESELLSGCAQAAKWGVFSVCVRPCEVARATRELNGTVVSVGTVIGFPQGGHHPGIKRAEAVQALADGAVELDMVANLGKIRERAWNNLLDEVAPILELTRGRGRLLKVILETAMLSDEEKIGACEALGRLGVDFVKTSTGYGDGGATVADVGLLRRASPPKVGVKASGGIRTLEQAMAMIEAGATRLGTASTGTLLASAGAGTS